MERVKLVVVLPIGPESKVSFVKDTLESIIHHTTASRKIIVLDDSRKNLGRKLKRVFPEIAVLKTAAGRGRKARLYFNLSQAMLFACENYSFDALLKMDDDALVIGKNPEDDAVRCFRRHSTWGSIGSFQTDCNGCARDFAPHRKLFFAEMSDEHFRQRPERRSGILFLRKLFKKSKAVKYRPGEHCQGGAHFMNGNCVRKLREMNLLGRREIAWSRLEDDVIFGLLICAAGFRHGDLATGAKPMGIRWRGLPCSPRELLNRRKKIIHSTRSFKNLSEERIRKFFRRRRAQ